MSFIEEVHRKDIELETKHSYELYARVLLYTKTVMWQMCDSNAN